MATRKIPDAELQLDVKAYYDCAGNRSEAARSRGLRRATYNDRLKMAEARLDVVLGKRVADGQIHARGSKQRRLPRSGGVARYILTSIQNNTHLHPAFDNLLALRDHLAALPGSSCELIVGTYSYQVSSYGPKAVKRGKFDRHAVHEALWYAPAAEPFIVDESVELAPGLVWCGEQNILPTARHPLTAFEDYNGRKSNIVPHAKVAMESVAAMADEAAKFNYSTGTITQRNYIQKRAGILAEQKHAYGALLVEVDADGNWFVRQLVVGDDDSVMDVGPDGTNGLRAQAGQVTEQPVVTSITFGDVHAAEMDKWVRERCWGPGGMVDELRPRYQFLHDVFSMRSRSHHEADDPHARFRKHVEDEETVEGEVQVTADFLSEAHRDFCETVVVPSNHDRHLTTWLKKADYREDPPNALYFLCLQLETYRAIEKGDRDFSVLEWALRQAGCPRGVRFMGQDESFVVHGVEHGLHGDLGPNGSRGSTRGLTKLGRPLNKGHDHTAAIRDHVYSVGACALRFPYMMGPSSHSVSHVVTYANGSRAIVTMWGGRWRA